jgi:hypothetical protein
VSTVVVLVDQETFHQNVEKPTLARVLYNGGAYSQRDGGGRAEKTFALDICEAMFGLRYSEVRCYLSGKPWMRGFKGIAWDVTVVVFDRRMRRL